MVKEAFNLHGVIPTNEAIVALALKDFATEVAAIMALGFVVNLIFALITPAKFVFLTGHNLLYMATVLAVVIGSAGIKGANLIILGAILQGTIATVMPALLHPFTKKLTNDAGFALGHYNSYGRGIAFQPYKYIVSYRLNFILCQLVLSNSNGLH